MWRRGPYLAAVPPSHQPPQQVRPQAFLRRSTKYLPTPMFEKHTVSYMTRVVRMGKTLANGVLLTFSCERTIGLSGWRSRPT